jgi:hypothetical protein
MFSNEGLHGQQIHFLVWYRNRIVGIMSAGASVYGTRPRDSFFGITKRNRKSVLPGIANNTVFRLIHHEKNLGTRCLALWRRVTPVLWHDIYNAEIFGFETFVEEAHNVDKEADETFVEVREVISRDGAVYRADNWVCVGTTSGSTKRHLGLNRTSRRRLACKKLVYCRRWKSFDAPIESDYFASWKAHTTQGTPEEKRRAAELTEKRKGSSKRRCHHGQFPRTEYLIDLAQWQLKMVLGLAATFTPTWRNEPDYEAWENWRQGNQRPDSTAARNRLIRWLPAKWTSPD